MSKPIKVKPAMYTLFFERLKYIAWESGYNLVLHGSLDRDMDIIAIPWVNKPKKELLLIQDFDRYLRGICEETKEHYGHSILEGGRSSYVISLNRGDKSGEWTRFDDEQYYIDISITPLMLINKKKPVYIKTRLWGL